MTDAKKCDWCETYSAPGPTWLRLERGFSSYQDPTAWDFDSWACLVEFARDKETKP